MRGDGNANTRVRAVNLAGARLACHRVAVRPEPAPRGFMRRALVILPMVLWGCESALPAPVTVEASAAATASPTASSAADVPLAPLPPELEAPGAQGCSSSTTGHHRLRFRADMPPFLTLAGASATVDLTVAGPAGGAMMRAVHRGFTVHGITAADDLALAPARPMVLGGFIVPAPDARLTWKATVPGTITVGFALEGDLEALPEAHLDASALPCDAVTLDVAPFDPSTAAPHSPQERAALLTAGKAVPISRTPEGAPIARLRVTTADAGIVVIETRGRRSLVRREASQGVVFGWVAASDVKPLPKDGVGEALGGGGFGLVGVGDSSARPRTVRCDRIVPLVAEVAGERRTIGSVAAGAVISLLERKGETFTVQLPDGFEADAAARIGVPGAHVESCPEAR
ncbi:hypothetical protein A7982_13442 [Minicystis rosea]|nr:hypothetical protein A7982_13442 [Minicystis rosea]